MANEVIITELGDQNYTTDGFLANIYGLPLTSQVLDIATVSAALSDGTSMVRLQSKTTGYWYNIGETAALAAATANTDGNYWLPANQHIDIGIPAGYFIDTAADVVE